VYSIAYSSVPIFIPQLYPHSYYNSRYGMELLPALALFAMVAAAALERWLTARGEVRVGALAGRLLQPVVLALAVLNTVAMIYRTPLVLKEAIVNATTRVPFERSVARAIADLPPGVPILMQNGEYIGALQDAGIPLKQTVNEGEWYSWHAALEDPAGHAAYVIAFEGDPVAKAVAEHPQGLTEMTILCGTGQKCARLYQSQRYGVGSPMR
jgi:hypothetical protein